MSEPKSVRINAVVTKNQRKKWKDYVEEEGEYSSLSDLIRTAVEREINRSDTNPQSEDSIQSGEILDRINELGQRFGSVESRLSAIESKSQKQPEIGQLATKIYKILPEIKPGSREWDKKKRDLHDESQVHDSQDIQLQKLKLEGTTEAFAQILDEPEYRIQEAIDKLQSDTYSVLSVEYDGQTRYYKEV